MRRSLVVFLLVSATCWASNLVVWDSTQPVYTDKIRQFGITWTFDQPYRYGTFANGDYWVVGPVTIVGIEPQCTEIDGRTVHGSEVDPIPGYETGLDSDLNVTYVAARNAALPNGSPVSPSNPLVVPNGSSLLSVWSDEDLTDNGNLASHILSAAILTVLDSAPAPNSFRPGYAGDSTKVVSYTVDDLDWSVLSSLAPVASTPEMTDVTGYFERPWIDHLADWMGRRLHPQLTMPEYGREIQQYLARGALMLNLDYTQDEKKLLLIRYVQVGLDLYSIATATGGTDIWINNGGHCGGRKLPILFAGKVLGDSDMVAIGQKSGDYLYSNGYGPPAYPSQDDISPPDYIHFGEDDQTFYVAQNDVDWTNSEYWDPDDRNGTPAPYTSGDIGLPEWGIVHCTGPWKSDKALTANYRDVVGCTLQGVVLAAHIMGLKDAWNHDVLFDYMDRYVELDLYLSDTFFIDMWTAYRANYPPVWSEQ